jgi:hypothetical protein
MNMDTDTTVSDWLRANGHPGDALVVALEEEYGYRYWLWVYPGTVEQLKADWKRGHAPMDFFDPSEGCYEGTMVEVTTELDTVEGTSERPLWPIFLAADKAGLYAHVHEPEDTFLLVQGEQIV